MSDVFQRSRFVLNTEGNSTIPIIEETGAPEQTNDESKVIIKIFFSLDDVINYWRHIHGC